MFSEAGTHTDMTSLLRRDVKHLSVLLALTTVTGIYLVASTVLIARDGVVFIELAQDLQTQPIATMLHADQHPGYPFLILAARVLSSLVCKTASVMRWIYCAQSVTLLCRVLSISIIYLIGRRLAGRRRAFWAALILLFLPDPAEYGSDTLSDWPHILFLMSGFLLLLSCAADKKRWPYAFIGVLAGLGYLIRPECVQLIIYSFLWEASRFLGLDRKEKTRAILALTLLVACFTLTAGPYMKLKGAVFPKKRIGQFARHLDKRAINKNQPEFSSASMSICGASGGVSGIVRSLLTLTERLGQNFLWYFLPFAFLGIFRYFRKAKWRKPEYFLPATFIVVNVLLMVWIWCHSEYMSRRHVLPLTVFLSLSIPLGVGLAASRMQRFASHHRQRHSPLKSRRFWFSMICLLGTILCLPKLLTPTRAEKRAYRQAADWLRANTDRHDKIILLETRIAFYAERKRLVGFRKDFFDKAKFLLHVAKSTTDTLAYKQFKEVRRWESGGTAVVVYATARRLLQSGEVSGMVAYWPMDDNAATTTVVESVIGCNGNSRRNTDLIAADGVKNGALLFDGISDFVDIGFEHVFSDEQWSVSIWFKTEKPEALQNFISSDKPCTLQWFGIHDGRLGIWDIEGGVWRHGNTFVENGVWNHVVLTYDGCGNYRFFLNGVLDGDRMNLGTKHDIGVLRYIGAYRDTKTRHFSGALDEIKIFDRAMTGPEVQELYEKGMFSPKTKTH